MSVSVVSSQSVLRGVSTNARGASRLRAAAFPRVPRHAAKSHRGTNVVALASPDRLVKTVTESRPPSLFQLAANANELVDGCAVNNTCGTVGAPPFALIGGAIVIGGAVLLIATFGLKGGADAASEMQERDSDFFGKK